MAGRRRRWSWYAVRVGRAPGVYTVWEECWRQVDGHPGCIYRGFDSRDDAHAFAFGSGEAVVDGTDDGLGCPAPDSIPHFSDFVAIDMYGLAHARKPSERRPAQDAVVVDGSVAQQEPETAPGSPGFRFGSDRMQADKDGVIVTAALRNKSDLSDDYVLVQPLTNADAADTDAAAVTTNSNADPGINATCNADSFPAAPSSPAAPVPLTAVDAAVVAAAAADDAIPIVPAIPVDIPAGYSHGAEQPSMPPPLDSLQEHAVELAMRGQNIFLTGGPGTGKTFTLQRIVQGLRERGNILVTAPTGVAAIVAGGQTMHSRPGPGRPSQTTEMFGNMWRSRDAWRRLNALVIDEISMVDAEFLDWYWATVCDIRRARDGFPGCPPLQLIVCGDFYQLPPVAKVRGCRSMNQGRADPGAHRNDAAHTPFSSFLEQCEVASGRRFVPLGFAEWVGKHAFQSAFWRSARLQVICLRRVYRTGDSLLLAALSEMRAGGARQNAVEALAQATARPLECHDSILPTKLYSTRNSVGAENASKLRNLDPSSRQVYHAADWVEPEFSYAQRALEQDAFFTADCPAAGELELRVGAQVMLLKNEVAPARCDRCAWRADEGSDTGGSHFSPASSADRQRTTCLLCGSRLVDLSDPAMKLVNGSRGVVVRFVRSNRSFDQTSTDPSPDTSLIACTDDSATARATGLDTYPATYSATHPTACAETDGGAPAMGADQQLPVYSGVGDGGDGSGGSKSNRDGSNDAGVMYPVVRFTNGREKMVLREEFEKVIYLRGRCVRLQLPLALAWALTIHKSQGATLSKVEVDLNNCFETGMAYVAISRASDVAGLRIRNFTRAAIRTNDLVRTFHSMVDEGRMDEFHRLVAPWWQPILEHPQPGWRAFFMRNPIFRNWVLESTEFGQLVCGGQPQPQQLEYQPVNHQSGQHHHRRQQQQGHEQQEAHRHLQPQQQPQAGFQQLPHSPPRMQADGPSASLGDMTPTQPRNLPGSPSSDLMHAPPSQYGRAPLFTPTRSPHTYASDTSTDTLAHAPARTPTSTPTRGPSTPGMLSPSCSQPVIVCRMGCQRAAKPGEYRPGRRWDTCCRECALSRGWHSAECEARVATTSFPLN